MNLSKYRINRTDKDEIKPEETLADALSDHSIIELPISRTVFRVIIVMALVAALFLLIESYRFQIVRGGHFAASIAKNIFPSYPAPALRGIIYDSQGVPLVENIPIFDLIAVHSELPASGEELNKTSRLLSLIIGLSVEDISKQFEENANVAVFVIKKDISKPEIARLKNLMPKGIYVLASSQRQYRGGGVYSSILGYTAKVNAADLIRDDYYLATDRIGRSGLEQYFEKELRGEHRAVIIGDASRTTSVGDTSESGGLDEKPGSNLYLNIDREMQSQLFKIMSGVLSEAGLRRGAALIQNPKTGAILAQVSLPAFDLNIFESADSADEAKKIKYLTDADKPLFNRIVSGRYSPGSTIKPLLALMGLKEKIVTPETKINATGSISVRSRYDPNIAYTFNDWKVHGWTDLKKAIADSVDVYFYALGGGYGNIRGLGESKIIGYLKTLLADKILGVDLPGEINGLVPDPEWKKTTKGEEWFVGDTYNISIGQGDLGVTPLWLNTYISAIANGGNLMKPYIVKEIKNSDNVTQQTINPVVLEKLPFDSQTLNTVKEGMRQTVESGTAQLLKSLPEKVAAKTGTAQFTGKKLNSLFVVFGPYDDPDISMTILVENIESQGLAVRVANDFLSWYFSKLSAN